MINLNSEWSRILIKIIPKQTLTLLERMIIDIYQTEIVYPPQEEIFRALNLVTISNLKVVILGQDPYHGPNQANGLAFSTDLTKLPPSLKNIFKELKMDLGIKSPNHGDLSSWAKQGVLLLNIQLTVLKGKPMSHKDFGWKQIITPLVKYLNTLDQPICFILWGQKAQEYLKYLKNPKHLYLKSVHPSPLSAYGGFFGSKPFSKTNQYLLENQVIPINWEIK